MAPFCSFLPRYSARLHSEVYDEVGIVFVEITFTMGKVMGRRRLVTEHMLKNLSFDRDTQYRCPGEIGLH